MKAIALLLCATFLIGCMQEPQDEFPTFEDEKLGFSLLYPAGFALSSQEENRIGFTDGSNNAIMIISQGEAATTDMRTLGLARAMQDLEADSIDDVSDIVKTILASDQQWYTYAIDFGAKDIKSIVSGTICNNNEIMVVLVTSQVKYDRYKVLYERMMGSFTCTDI